MTSWAVPATEPSTSAHWSSPEFRAELAAWLDEQADVIGAVDGLEATKHRSWSTVWRVEADAGIFWAKQNCRLQSFEAALVADLVRLSPRDVVPVAAFDRDRGLLLTPDQGAVLEEHADVTDPRVWQRLVTAAGELQRDVVPHVDELVDRHGLTVLRPQDTEAYVAGRVDAYAALPASDPRRLDADIARRLLEHLPVVRGWGEEVAALGLPLTLNHNDLHARNAFVTADGLRFFDFGDAVVTDPLGVLYLPFFVMAHHWDAEPDHEWLRLVADTALEMWSDLAPLPALRAALPAALQLGKLARVESWTRSLVSATPDELVRWGDGPAGTLAMLLDDPPVRP